MEKVLIKYTDDPELAKIVADRDEAIHSFAERVEDYAREISIAKKECDIMQMRFWKKVETRLKELGLISKAYSAGGNTCLQIDTKEQTISEAEHKKDHEAGVPQELLNLLEVLKGSGAEVKVMRTPAGDEKEKDILH